MELHSMPSPTRVGAAKPWFFSRSPSPSATLCVDVKSLSFEARERLMLLMLVVVSVAPVIPFTGGSTLYDWMSQYTMDTIGGARTGYVMTYLLCWILCALPWVVWMIIESMWNARQAPDQEVKSPRMAGSSRMPKLEELRATFHAGMTKDDFFEACDSMLERFGGLRMGMPSANDNLISIHVAEGDVVLFFFLSNDELGYAEYKGDIFLGE